MPEEVVGPLLPALKAIQPGNAATILTDGAWRD